LIKESTVDWWIWRPVLHDVATYSEIITRWDLDDLLECHRALNLKSKIDEIGAETPNKGKGKRP